MFGIGHLFGRVRNSFTKEIVLRTAVKEAVKASTGIDLAIENITVRNSTVAIKNLGQTAKSAIFIKKPKILEALNSIGIKDIR